MTKLEKIELLELITFFKLLDPENEPKETVKTRVKIQKIIETIPLDK
jgi:hypothetical protein